MRRRWRRRRHPPPARVAVVPLLRQGGGGSAEGIRLPLYPSSSSNNKIEGQQHTHTTKDRRRKNVFKFGRESDTLKYKKQRKKVNNMKKKAKENFESNLDNIRRTLKLTGK